LHFLALGLRKYIEFVPNLQSIRKFHVHPRTLPNDFCKLPLQSFSINFPSPDLKLSLLQQFLHSFEVDAAFDDAMHIYPIKFHEIDGDALSKGVDFILNLIELPLEVQIVLGLQLQLNHIRLVC
jgi:hypothetical protein